GSGPDLPMTCHAAPAYHLVIETGVDGLHRRVEQWQAINSAVHPESGPWYEALHITLSGVSAYIAAHAEAAAQAAVEEMSSERRAELQQIANACRHVAHGWSRTFFEAVQLY